MTTAEDSPPVAPDNEPPEEPTARLSHGEIAMQDAIREMPATAREGVWLSWQAWRERAPVLSPDGRMPWDPLPSPRDPGAVVTRKALQDGLVRILRAARDEDGIIDHPQAEQALKTFVGKMVELEAEAGPEGGPCAYCGKPCPRPGLTYCSASHRQGAYERRKRERSMTGQHPGT